MHASIFLGMILGMLASGVHVVILERDQPLTRLIGGLLGGIVAAAHIGAGELDTTDVALMLLVGYVAADLLARITGVDSKDGGAS